MHHREGLVGYRTPAETNVLILPVIIDDGDCFPVEVQEMQGQKIHEFAITCMCPDGPRQEAFAAHLKNWVPRIEQALQHVPPFDPAWETIAYDQFQEMFRIKVAALTTLPGLSLLPMKGAGAKP
jgi:hypothetical protein